MLDLSQLNGFKPEISGDFFHKKRGALNLLLHHNKSNWVIVNDVGMEIIKLCNGSLTAGEIASLIAERYNANLACINRDVESYLSQLFQASFFNNHPHKCIKSSKHRLSRLHLNITERCNLRCIHCGVINETANNRELKKEKVFDIIDQLSVCEDASLAVSGGEPLLHKDCIDILDYAARRVKTSLSTNATLINKETAKRLSRLNVSFQISMDGHESYLHDAVRGDGAYEKTIAGIRLLQKQGAGDRITLFMTVMKHNIEFVPNFIKFAEDMGIPSIRLLSLQCLGSAGSSWHDINPTPQEYSKLYTYLYQDLPDTTLQIGRGLQGFLLDIPDGDRWCRLGDTLMVDSGGDIYPCSLMTHPEFLIGNIENMSLEKALNSDKLKGIINVCSKREERIEKCRNCAWKNFCQASCPGSVFSQKNTFQATDELCDIRERLYTDMMFAMAEKKWTHRF